MAHHHRNDLHGRRSRMYCSGRLSGQARAGRDLHQQEPAGLVGASPGHPGALPREMRFHDPAGVPDALRFPPGAGTGAQRSLQQDGAPAHGLLRVQPGGDAHVPHRQRR